MIGRGTPPPEAQATEQADLRGFDDFALQLGDIMRGERATLGKSLLDVQRELKIKAAYIAAIENSAPTAFETPGFIAGYVRSYARYLGKVPVWAYTAFCRVINFETAHGMSAAASSPRAPTPGVPRPKTGDDPFADPSAPFVPKGQAFMATIEPGAIGSSAVLLALIGLIGFGGLQVFKEIQQVQMTPGDQAPGVVAELDPIAGAIDTRSGETTPAGRQPFDRFERIYRPETLETPVLTPRDGPIANLDPRQIGAFRSPPEIRDIAASGSLSGPGAISAPGTPVLPAAPSGFQPQTAALTPRAATPLGSSVRVAEPDVPELVLFAVRPAWVRVRSAEGNVLLEKILDAGEEFTLPATEEPPVLRAGNGGGVYFAINGQTYGPAGGNGQVVTVDMSVEDLQRDYAVADPGADIDLQRILVAQAAAGAIETPADSN